MILDSFFSVQIEGCISKDVSSPALRFHFFPDSSSREILIKFALRMFLRQAKNDRYLLYLTLIVIYTTPKRIAFGALVNSMLTHLLSLLRRIRKIVQERMSGNAKFVCLCPCTFTVFYNKRPSLFSFQQCFVLLQRK